ncbi:hypothetical protein JANAI62_14280 [Jannaschia pagri]|uniref:Uncharacterized protein n=1 Tax=Jannaschia pagri TaxID=2829797 RepID=A0ABQ4NK56_9RHOB|nr:MULTISPECIES: hypothetical protein [unclassified Jannaschia]GIT90973.1 hypothetical protein JANAI61_14310 [Jannaschia sp. AI_61]GIT94805.1 hypothetical protein JANAI62_14280 [Jannaschia sp. AI_62]
METVAGWWAAVQAWWAAVPPVPPLGLPAPGDPDVLIVIGTVVLAVGMMGFVSGWVERRVSWASVFALLLAAALFVWVWEPNREEFGWISIPEAFVEMVARVIR